MQTSASYLLQWETVKLLKEMGIREYDLNGINPELNAGTYQFKRGLAGKNGREVTFVGQFQAFQGSLTNHGLLLLDRMRYRMRTLRTRGLREVVARRWRPKRTMAGPRDGLAVESAGQSTRR
jgi:lipid II:glycine glycyltransferase (peptidoglycan interpeptide bridge formation enzyme)